MEYRVEKLYTTVLILASSSGSLRERLADAVVSQFIRLRDDDFADLPEAQERFHRLREALTKEKATGTEGNIQATIEKMTEETARKLVEEIVGLFLDSMEASSSNR